MVPVCIYIEGDFGNSPFALSSREEGVRRVTHVF
jgi:hypothetical protein